MASKRKHRVPLDPTAARRRKIRRLLAWTQGQRQHLGDDPAVLRLESREAELRRDLDRLPRAA